MKKNKVLVITQKFGTFVKRDMTILEKEYVVKSHLYTGRKSAWSNIFAQIKLDLWLFYHIWTTHAILVWFADYHAFLPALYSKIWKKRMLLVEGGYDTAAIPEIGYGSFISSFRGKFSRYGMKNASLNLPVCDNIAEEVKERAPGANIEILYTGYDPEVFFPKGIKSNTVLTVAEGKTLQRIKIKGIDHFVKVAGMLPHYDFIVIGIDKKAVRFLGDLPSNVKILPRMSQNELLDHYRKAKVYAQFSMREGLPNAVCEAMLCECIPVGYTNGGIPVAIGEAGYLTETNTPEAGANAVRKAMEDENDLGRSAREQIIDKFPLVNRERKLLQYIKEKRR